jgi:flagellar biosynthesis protein FlhG
MTEALDEISGKEGPRIWAIGGGKGGVGKSVIAVNLGVALAKNRQQVIVVDADLGGANLHTLLGMPDPDLSLSDYLARRARRLSDIVLPTSVPGLNLVSGARALYEMANPKHGQKQKLLGQISELESDHVILDLGAGTTFNVLDFFLVAHRGILVVVPEPTSVENAYAFIRSAFFRTLKQTEPRARVAAALDAIAANGGVTGPKSARDMVAEITAVDATAGAAVQATAAGFGASIVVNRAISTSHERLANEIGMACREYYGIGVEALGSLPTDPLVARSVIDREPVVAVHPDCPFSQAVRRLARKLKGAHRG